MAGSDGGGTRRSRRGSERDAELLAATLDVLRETGYDKLTVDAVAAQARASKATVYRRWPSKADLVVAAFSNALPAVPEPVDTGSLRGDLSALMRGLGEEIELLGDLIAGLIGEMRHNPELAAAFERDFLASRIRLARLAFERAAERGELADGVDADLASEIAPALLLHHGVLRRQRISRARARAIVETVAALVERPR